jgi:hypothetical protein
MSAICLVDLVKIMCVWIIWWISFVKCKLMYYIVILGPCYFWAPGRRLCCMGSGSALSVGNHFALAATCYYFCLCKRPITVLQYIKQKTIDIGFSVFA